MIQIVVSIGEKWLVVGSAEYVFPAGNNSTNTITTAIYTGTI